MYDPHVFIHKSFTDRHIEGKTDKYLDEGGIEKPTDNNIETQRMSS